MLKPSPPDALRLLRHTLATCLGAATLAAQAAPPKAVEPFAATTWAAVQAELKRPTAVVFTTTDCPHCPAVIEDLARSLPRRRIAAPLLVVVMDVAPGEGDEALLADAHYRVADRLLAFDGQAAALRHGVNPQWRGVTPYVGLLAPGQAPSLVTGPPSKAELTRWAARQPR